MQHVEAARTATKAIHNFEAEHANQEAILEREGAGYGHGHAVQQVHVVSKPSEQDRRVPPKKVATKEIAANHRGVVQGDAGRSLTAAAERRKVSTSSSLLRSRRTSSLPPPSRVARRSRLVTRASSPRRGCQACSPSPPPPAPARQPPPPALKRETAPPRRPLEVSGRAGPGAGGGHNLKYKAVRPARVDIGGGGTQHHT